MNWHWVDYIIISVIGLSIITGLVRGFVKELVALCVWTLAIWLAYHYSSSLNDWLQAYIQDDKARKAAAFIGILLGTLIVGGLFNALLSFILSRSGLSGTDRILGMGFGLVRGIFIIGLVMLVARMTSMPVEEYRLQSKFYSKLDPLVEWMTGYVPDFINQVKTYDKDNPLELTDNSSELVLDNT